MSAPWVKTALPPQIGPLPAWVILPLPYLLLSFGTFSIAVMVLFVGLGWYLTHKGRTLTWTVRRIRTSLRGYKMDARPLGYRRAMNMDVPVHDFNFDKWRDS